jgi:hypothetical protein
MMTAASRADVVRRRRKTTMTGKGVTGASGFSRILRISRILSPHPLSRAILKPALPLVSHPMGMTITPRSPTLSV